MCESVRSAPDVKFELLKNNEGVFMLCLPSMWLFKTIVVLLSTTKVVWWCFIWSSWLYLFVFASNLFSKNRHDWTQITQAGELQAQKSPRGEGLFG